MGGDSVRFQLCRHGRFRPLCLTPIDEMKKATKVQRDIKIGGIFNLGFVKKANEELKSAGWKP